MAGTPFQAYGNAAILPSIQKRADASRNVGARTEDKLMPSSAPELKESLISISSLSRVYALIGTNTRQSYGVVVVNI